MIITGSAPTRISLFGGGTDISPFCDIYNGLCINIAINLRQRMIMYSGDDVFITSNQFPPQADPNFYYTFFKEFNIDGGKHTKLIAEVDCFIKSGLGTSASAAVLLIGLINKRLNLDLTKHEIALKAWDIEVNKIGLFGGKQDQFAAVYGGFNAIEFKKGKVKIESLEKDKAEFILKHLLLFYVGGQRESSKIQEGFKELNKQQISPLLSIRFIADKALQVIADCDIKKIGELFDEAWEYKKQSNKGVTTEKIDNIYQTAKEAGALGGKICGSGGQGYMIFLSLPENQEKIEEALYKKHRAERVDFGICWNGLETKKL